MKTFRGIFCHIVTDNKILKYKNVTKPYKLKFQLL